MTQRVPYERKEDSHGLAIARGTGEADGKESEREQLYMRRHGELAERTRRRENRESRSMSRPFV